jgi:hypothetical protein
MASIVGDGTALHVTFDSESHSSTYNLSWRKQVTLNTPFKGTRAARLPAGKFLENYAFRYRETSDFDCHRVERTSFRAVESQRLSRRTISTVKQLIAESAYLRSSL